MDTSRSDIDVLVVGGGIGGLANALALSRKGFRVRLLERAPQFGEVGAGLQIAPNCTRILDSWGLLEEVASQGVQPDSLVMRDALDGSLLTQLDLSDARRRYGFPYLVIHRSDLHKILLQACQRAGVDLVNNVEVTGYEQTPDGAAAIHKAGRYSAPAVIAADGLFSVARPLFSDDKPLSSAYVAYRGAIPADQVASMDVSMRDVVVYVGPHCHFVQYPLRRGEMFNQVAVFRSPKAMTGQHDWGTPDELDAAFAPTCPQVRDALSLMWRDRWWPMFDREPLTNYVQGRIALSGDAAHPPLQYLAQGAVMAIEDAWVLSEHAGERPTAGEVAWDDALAAYDAARTKHCRRVQMTARSWGDLWHLSGAERVARNALLRRRDVHDYTFIDWLYGPTALTPEQEPAMFTPLAIEAPVGS